MKSNARTKQVTKALRTLIPLAPMEDFLAIQAVSEAGHLRHLPPSIAAWQAVTARARHAHTEYDLLLKEGYDRDSALHFVIDDMHETLLQWGCTKTIDVSNE